MVIPADFRRLEAYRTLAPLEAEKAFISANPGLDADEIAVTCDKRFLREVRICMSKDLEFRSCPEVDRRSCRPTRWSCRRCAADSAGFARLHGGGLAASVAAISLTRVARP